MAPRPSEIVRELPAVLKLTAIAVLFLWLAAVVAVHAGHRPPPPAPCPPRECTLHPHAPRHAVNNP